MWLINLSLSSYNLHLLLSYFFSSFSHQRKPMVSHWSLSKSKSSQVSRTLLTILANLDNAIVWMLSTHPLISRSSNPCTILWWLYKEHQYPRVCRTFLSILANLNNTVAYSDLIRPPISISSSPLFNPFEAVPSAPITTGIIFILVFHNFLSSQAMYGHYHYYYYYYYLLIRVFQINVSWWFFTGVWVTTSLHKSPGLFLLFWPFSIM